MFCRLGALGFSAIPIRLRTVCRIFGFSRVGIYQNPRSGPSLFFCEIASPASP